MKILVLQLARLGDIFTTWPVIRALKRTFPQAEISILVRKRFREACAGLGELDEIILLETDHILEPLIGDSVDIETSKDRLESLVSHLKERKFDKVINLSFSPASSYLCHLISGPDSDTNVTEVKGYTRHADLSLNVNDSISAYFYAQAGIARDSRIHTSDLMAAVAGVDLIREDWKTPLIKTADQEKPILSVHIGASQPSKTISPQIWARALKEIGTWWTGKIFLLGSSNEMPQAEELVKNVNSDNVISMVGRTTLENIFEIVQSSALLIGCDSSLIHVASLTSTPTLNVSFACVNFWETGPKAPSSRVLFFQSPADTVPIMISEEAKLLLEKRESVYCIVESPSQEVAYKFVGDTTYSSQWELIKAIYFDGTWPKGLAPEILMAFEKLNQLNSLALEQIAFLEKDPKNLTASQILDRVDEMVEVIAQLVPDAGPVVRWLQTEKSRVPPGPFVEVLEKTREAHLNLFRLLASPRTMEATL